MFKCKQSCPHYFNMTGVALTSSKITIILLLKVWFKVVLPGHEIVFILSLNTKLLYENAYYRELLYTAVHFSSLLDLQFFLVISCNFFL